MKILLCLYRVLLLLLLAFIGYELYYLQASSSLSHSLPQKTYRGPSLVDAHLTGYDELIRIDIQKFQERLFSKLELIRTCSSLSFDSNQKISSLLSSLEQISSSLKNISATLDSIERKLSNTPSSSQIGTLEDVLREISDNTSD